MQDQDDHNEFWKHTAAGPDITGSKGPAAFIMLGKLTTLTKL